MFPVRLVVYEAMYATKQPQVKCYLDHVVVDTSYDHKINVYCPQRSFHKAVMVYKSLNGLAPEYMQSMFILQDTVYSLRDTKGKLNIPKPRTNYLKDSFSCTGVVLWNTVVCQLGYSKQKH